MCDWQKGAVMGKTYVCRNFEPINEYTTPIKDTPSYRNSGIIKAVSEDGEKIQVGRITYEAFENEEFQYIITPFWEIIDTLPASVFQGIPGIDMDMRLEHYYRVNYVPVFMTERTPGPNREDLWELLDSVNLPYYDRLEWLIRTDLTAACDNLIVERAREESKVEKITNQEELQRYLEEGQYGDEIIVENLHTLGRSSAECTKSLNRLMHYGIALSSLQEGVKLSVEDYKSFLPIFATMYKMDRENKKNKQRAGIEKAKENGVYKGRKRISVDEEFFKDIVNQLKEKKITVDEALKVTGFSKATFYRRMREIK